MDNYKCFLNPHTFRFKQTIKITVSASDKTVILAETAKRPVPLGTFFSVKIFYLGRGEAVVSKDFNANFICLLECKG